MYKNLTKQLFLLAFIEGGAVMCVELCGAKILSPYFGTSIYVWAAVLGITLTALMVGYYLGGYLSTKNKSVAFICWVMLVAGCLVTLTPLISKAVLSVTIQLNLLTGTVISLFSFLFFPLVLFGATSPLIINFLTQQKDDSGKSSGTVYAVSTFGGIITTFFVGFYLLPEFGIAKTLYGYGLLVVCYSILLLLLIKSFNYKTLIFLILALISYDFKPKTNQEIIYQSDGILGELKVVDRVYNDSKVYRELMVNNISQTIMDKNNPEKSYWQYVDLLTYNINSYSDSKQTLLLGLGGGTLYKQLIKSGLEVDVVEIDQRIEDVAKQYFFIDKMLNVVVDDARHYINTTTKKYDVIIYDLYHSETPPVHLMTSEAFSEIKQKLNKGGLLVVNFYGFLKDKKGLAARSIYKTIVEEGFKVDLYATEGEENRRNLLFICGKDELQRTSPIIHKKIESTDFDWNNAIVLMDDKPLLEHIYLEAALSWRKDYNEINAKYFLQK
ncbi:MAG: fused MFS/spermidine synthase [Flavobacteriales bacterium]